MKFVKVKGWIYVLTSFCEDDGPSASDESAQNEVICSLNNVRFSQGVWNICWIKYFKSE